MKIPQFEELCGVFHQIYQADAAVSGRLTGFIRHCRKSFEKFRTAVLDSPELSAITHALPADCQPRRFDGPSGPAGAVKRDAQVAQLVEQRIENPRVGGSIPPLGTNKIKHLAEYSRKNVLQHVAEKSQ